MARRAINRKTQRDLGSVTPIGAAGAPEIVGFGEQQWAISPVISTPSYGPRDVATAQNDEDGSDQAFPASLVGLDRKRYLRKRTGAYGNFLNYADNIEPNSGFNYGTPVGSMSEETFDELEHEVKYQDVNPNYLAGYSTPLGVASSMEHFAQRFDDYATHGIKETIPDRAGVPTDLGHTPKSYVLFDYQRPFDQLASQRLYGTKGVYAMVAVGEPKMTVNEAVGKFPAPGMTAFGTQVPTDRTLPDIWYQEELNSTMPHMRKRGRY